LALATKCKALEEQLAAAKEGLATKEEVASLAAERADAAASDKEGDKMKKIEGRVKELEGRLKELEEQRDAAQVERDAADARARQLEAELAEAQATASSTHPTPYTAEHVCHKRLPLQPRASSAEHVFKYVLCLRLHLDHVFHEWLKRQYLRWMGRWGRWRERGGERDTVSRARWLEHVFAVPRAYVSCVLTELLSLHS
jgi:hypothetical protein